MRMCTNNELECPHEERRLRSRVVLIFPDRACYMRLMTALAMEQSEDRLSGHHYLDMKVLEEELIEIRASLPMKSVPA